MERSEHKSLSEFTLDIFEFQKMSRVQFAHKLTCTSVLVSLVLIEGE